jgi:hypothetical protein
MEPTRTICIVFASLPRRLDAGGSRNPVTAPSSPGGVFVEGLRPVLGEAACVSLGLVGWSFPILASSRSILASKTLLVVGKFSLSLGRPWSGLFLDHRKWHCSLAAIHFQLGRGFGRSQRRDRAFATSERGARYFADVRRADCRAICARASATDCGSQISDLGPSLGTCRTARAPNCR